MGFGTYRLLKPIKRRLKPYKQAVRFSLELCDNDIKKYFTYLSRYIDLYKTRGFLPEEATKLGLLNFDGKIEEHL
jgi:hypothetical protein